MRTFLISLAAFTVIFLAVIFGRSNHYKVERTTVVHAAPAIVFPFVSKTALLTTWLPAVRVDPKVKLEASADALTWSGLNGTGSLTVSAREAPSRVTYAIEHTAPQVGHETGVVTLESHPEGTLVKFVVEGEHVGSSKAYSLVMDLNRTLGADLQNSLESLANLAASRAEAAAPTLDAGVEADAPDAGTSP